MIEQQINLIRSEMAKNLIDANKFGNINLCRNGNNKPNKIKEYCDANFVDNFQKNTNCKEGILGYFHLEDGKICHIGFDRGTLKKKDKIYMLKDLDLLDG